MPAETGSRPQRSPPAICVRPPPRFLGRAKLNDTQLTALAGGQLPQADPLIVPHLLDAFRASQSEAAGKAMVKGLLHSSHPIDGIAAERVPELLKIYPASVRTAAEPILARIEKEK